MNAESLSNFASGARTASECLTIVNEVRRSASAGEVLHHYTPAADRGHAGIHEVRTPGKDRALYLYDTPDRGIVILWGKPMNTTSSD